MKVLQHVRNRLHLGRPVIRAGGRLPAEDLPLQNLRRVGHVAGQGQPGAPEAGLEIIERPGVVVMEPQIGLDVGLFERAAGRGGWV